MGSFRTGSSSTGTFTGPRYTEPGTRLRFRLRWPPQSSRSFRPGSRNWEPATRNWLTVAAPRPDRRTLIRVSRLRNSVRLHENWYRRSRSPSVLASNDRRSACRAASASARWRCAAASVSSRAIAPSATLRSVATASPIRSHRAGRRTGGRADDRPGRRSPGSGWRADSRTGSPTPAAVRFSGGLPSRRTALDLLGPGPGAGLVEDVVELGPAVEQPLAAGGRRFEAADDRLGVVQDVQGLRTRRGLPPREQGVEDLAVEAGVAIDVAVAEEATAQRRGLFPLTVRLLRRHGSMMWESRAASARSARSSRQEACTACSTRNCSTSFWGWRSAVQVSTRNWRTLASSPGRTRVLAVMPCFTALNRERFLPSGVRGPVLFWALRRLISARSMRRGCRGHGGLPRVWMRRKSSSA